MMLFKLKYMQYGSITLPYKFHFIYRSVFIADEKFLDVHDFLLKRGWKCNPSLKSKMFNLKVNVRDVEFD